METLRPIDAVLISLPAGMASTSSRRLLLGALPDARQRPVKVTRLSTTGCDVVGFEGEPVAQSVAWLKFPGWLPLSCAAEPAGDGTLRCTFTQPLYESDVLALVGYRPAATAAGQSARPRCTFLRG